VTEATVPGRAADPANRPNADTWVIVRCFNEAPVVASVIASLAKDFANIIGVDDGSTDGSSDAMRGAGAHVVRHPVNLGAGAALQTGIEFVVRNRDARYLLCFDADGQHRVSDAIAMLDILRSGNLDVVLGSRFLGQPQEMPAGRRALLRAARVFERLASGAELTDAHNGLRAFTRDFASTIHLTIADMAYATELTDFIVKSGARFAKHPVTIDYTPYALAKGQQSVNAINIAFDIWLHRTMRGRR